MQAGLAFTRRPLPLLLFGMAWLGGCASTGAGREADAPADRPASVAAPWEIPEAEWRTQRIVLAHYSGPEGSGALRLVLRFESPDRFHVSASDRLGRRWWELNVQNGQALVLWVRERIYCRYGGDLEIPALSLGPVPAGAVAALLMHRLPAPPAAGGRREGASVAGTPQRGGEIDFRDRRGRRWTAAVSGRGPDRWTLWRGDRPRASWSAADDGTARLVESDTGLELRWRQRRRATRLAGPLAPPRAPAGFRAGACNGSGARADA